MTGSKSEAFQFLRSLENSLRSVPVASAMEAWVRSTSAAAKSSHELRHLHSPEAAFLNAHVIPALFAAVTAMPGMTDESARHALLNEYYRSLPEYSTDTPCRTARHPFTKVLGAKADEIYSRWLDPQGRPALVQSCPDFALRAPFPHKIVFEGKYFPNGSLKYARQELVTNIYQAFFYGGLPPVPRNARGRAEWDYDYACLLAYDASPTGTFRKAWKELPRTVRKGFWDGANLYVMIIGGQGRVI